MMPSPTSSDSELVTRALNGESDAFAELYNRYFSSIYDFLHRTMRNGEEAADLAQETFLHAMQSLNSLTKAGAFKSWLFSIAHHLALNRLERQKRFVEPAPLSAEEQPEADPLLYQVDTDRLANPEEAAEMKETARLVWEAAASLDKRTYTVLDLHVRKGLETGEIAEVLGVSSGNAYTLIHRMKRALEEAISSYLLMRRGSKRCEKLRQMVELFAIPPVTQQMRKTVERHVRKCEICAETKRTLMPPLSVFGAFAAVPAPAGLQQHIWGNLAGIWSQVGPPSYLNVLPARPKGRGPRGVVRRTFPGTAPWSGQNYTTLLLVLIGAAFLTTLFVMNAFSLPGKGSSSPELIVTATKRPTITRAPTRTITPTVEETPTVEATPTVTFTPEPTQEPVTPTRTPRAHSTPEPTDTPWIYPTPTIFVPPPYVPTPFPTFYFPGGNQ
jgi:RNA polymerase sigma factor (sigma-70 family)